MVEKHTVCYGGKIDALLWYIMVENIRYIRVKKYSIIYYGGEIYGMLWWGNIRYIRVEKYTV